MKKKIIELRNDRFGFNTVAGILETLFCVAFLYGFVRFVLGEKMSFFRITGFRLSAFGVTAAILLPAAGLMFSLITYSADSIWDAVLVHAVWNALILGVVHISTAGGLRLLVNYRIDSGNILITGGRFGIEAGLPASAAFIIVCIAAVFKIKRKSRAGAG